MSLKSNLESVQTKLTNILNPNKKILGLDIGLSSIKIIHIEGDSLDTAELKNYVIEQIPENLNLNSEQITEESSQTIEEIGNLVRKSWESLNTNVKTVAVSLPSSSVICKKIYTQLYNDDDLMLYFETAINEHIPSGTEVADIVYDYQILGKSQRSDNEQEVMLVIAKKEKIDQRLAIIAAAGLVPVILEPEQFTIQNILRLKKGEEFNSRTYLLVDASSTSLKLSVYRNGELIFTKDMPIGGLTLTKDIMYLLNCSISEAEIYKSEVKTFEGYQEIKDNFMSMLISEFLTGLHYFSSSTNNNKIDEIILIGGLSGMKNFEDYFKKAIEDQTEVMVTTLPQVGNLIREMPKSKYIINSKLEKDEAGLFLASALALRQFLRKY